MESRPRSEPASLAETVVWAFTQDSAEERPWTKIVSGQLLARRNSDDLRCLFRKLTGRKKYNIWKQRQKES